VGKTGKKIKKTVKTRAPNPLHPWCISDDPSLWSTPKINSFEKDFLFFIEQIVIFLCDKKLSRECGIAIVPMKWRLNGKRYFTAADNLMIIFCTAYSDGH
jgi:hypothetical protein